MLEWFRPIRQAHDRPIPTASSPNPARGLLVQLVAAQSLLSHLLTIQSIRQALDRPKLASSQRAVHGLPVLLAEPPQTTEYKRRRYAQWELRNIFIDIFNKDFGMAEGEYGYINSGSQTQPSH